ncbi:hypothetical protein SRHO_G00007170 [Serrasalmus rhombeus]
MLDTAACGFLASQLDNNCHHYAAVFATGRGAEMARAAPASSTALHGGGARGRDAVPSCSRLSGGGVTGKGRICRRYKVAYRGTEAIGISWVVEQGLGPQSAGLS